MKKKKGGGGGANWMDTYGDMVTLLLCFFVLLYSMSTISEENFKALVASFNPTALLDITQTPEGGTGPSADEDLGAGVYEVPSDANSISQEDVEQALAMLAEAIEDYAEESGMQQSVSVTNEGGTVYVSFRDTAFFNGDSSELRPDAYPILDMMSEVLSEHAWAIDSIHVEGHTAQAGTTPNNTRTDRTLSSMRSTNVVIYIQDHTDWNVLNPGKLVTVGLGQWHPVADNDTAEGMAANRRVEFEISGLDLEEALGDNIESYTTPEYSTS